MKWAKIDLFEPATMDINNKQIPQYLLQLVIPLLSPYTLIIEKYFFYFVVAQCLSCWYDKLISAFNLVKRQPIEVPSAN